MSQSNISAEMVSSIFKIPESPKRELNGESGRNNSNTSADQSSCLPVSSSETQLASSVSPSVCSGKHYLSSASPLHWSSSPDSATSELPYDSDSVERGERSSKHCPDMQWRLEADVKRVHTADYVDR